jgi:adenylylsulfate kinase-like enzyme
MDSPTQTVGHSNEPADTAKILHDRINQLRISEPSESRIIIALAGIPGSGKSSVAAALLAHLHRSGVQDVIVVPMVRIKLLL